MTEGRTPTYIVESQGIPAGWLPPSAGLGAEPDNFPYRPCPLCVAVLETRDSDIWVHGETGDIECHGIPRAGRPS
jgi:hypothetical protein